MHCKPYVSAIVLAAGTSSRMGADNKLLLKIANKSILRLTVENVVRSRVDEVIAVCGPDLAGMKIELKSLKAVLCSNHDYSRGMSTSIKAGICMVRHDSDGAMILLADQPNLQPETIDRFIEKFEKTPRKIIAGSYRNTLGNPVLFPRCFFDELRTLKGDVGARSVVNSHRDDVETIAIAEEEIFDIDRPEDFERMKSLLGK